MSRSTARNFQSRRMVCRQRTYGRRWRRGRGAAFVGRRARVRTLEAQLATDASNLSVAELAECFPQSFEVFVPKGGKDEWVRALDLRPTERPVQAWRMGARQAGRTGLRRVAVGPKIP